MLSGVHECGATKTKGDAENSIALVRLHVVPLSVESLPRQIQPWNTAVRSSYPAATARRESCKWNAMS
jgi:hypothetical protein